MSVPNAPGLGGGVHRGASNRNSRGGSPARQARKAFLLETFGDGEQCYCARRGCTTILTFDTVTVERIVPGCEGGTYRRDNILPYCAPCNSELGGAMSSPKARANRNRRAARKAYRAATAASAVADELASRRRADS